MKAFVITLTDNDLSKKAAAVCMQSSMDVGNEFSIKSFKAFGPNEVEEVIKSMDLMIKWNWPWEGEVIDFVTGLKKTAYRTKNPLARIGCSLSHLELWTRCSMGHEAYLILEHDAFFTKKLNYKDLILHDKSYDIIGINDPRGATRKSGLFHSLVQSGKSDIVNVPHIDDSNIPQGLAGNSAYILKPNGAKNLVKAVMQYGLWPNDAIMCRQLIPRMGVTKTYYTAVQKLERSTTAD